MRILAVFLVALMFCGTALAIDYVQRSAPIVAASGGTDTLYFFASGAGTDTLTYVSGFSLWSTGACSLKTIPYGFTAIPASEVPAYIPKEGVSIVGATRAIVIWGHTSDVYGYGWIR